MMPPTKYALKSRKSNRLLQRLLHLSLCFSLQACAEIYQWQDEKGSKHFSDRTHENSRLLNIKPRKSFVKVTKVFDGDTVLLEDGRKVRLLGINTPEVKHKGQDTEAGGETAKRWLIEKLKNRKVTLVSDSERTDKYKRTLAHLFTENKEHINLQLVEKGLAAVNIYPPNLLYVNELSAAGIRAEKAKRGIWQQPEYAVIPVTKLDPEGHSGWLRIKGRVSIIRNSRKFVYLELTDRLQARIEKKWLSLFPDINTYQGKIVEARGWLNKNRGGWSILIRHPSALIMIER